MKNTSVAKIANHPEWLWDTATSRTGDYIHLLGMAQSRHTVSFFKDTWMLLRQAYAHTLRFLRERKGLKQLDLAGRIDASYISRLERGDNAVTIETSESLSAALDVAPLALLALVHSAKQGVPAKAALEQAMQELKQLGLLDECLPVGQTEPVHPSLARGLETTKAVQALKADGVSQADAARILKLSTSTVGRHWNRPFSS